jgi:hypothetical protein
MMGRELSDVQKGVLRSVLNYIRHIEEHGSEVEKARIGDHAFRVPLHWLRRYGYNRTPSDSAAFSRSLRSLEQRGLILRTNVQPASQLDTVSPGTSDNHQKSRMSERTPSSSPRPGEKQRNA